MGQDHIVGNGVDLTGLAQAQVIFLTADGVDAHQQLAVLVPVDLLQHLALAAAGSALVHEDHLVLIGGLQHGGGGVVGDPALVLADVQQDGEHALLGRGAGIEVVGKDLMQVLAAAVDNHLLAVKMGVTERRRHIDDGPGLIVLLHVKDADEALHIGQGEGEESSVHGADHQAVIAVVLPAGLERQDDQLLAGQPVHGFLPEFGELVAIFFLEKRLVGGQIVPNAHTIRITAAHIVLHEVDHGAVLAADHLGLLHKAPAFDGVDHVIAGGMGRPIAHFLQLLLGLRVAQAAAFLQRLGQVLGQDESVKIRVCIHITGLFLCNIFC